MRMPACPCNVADAVDGNWMLVTGSPDVKIFEDAICYDHIPSYGTSRGRVYSVWPPECRRPPECRFLGKMVSDASYQTIHGNMVPNFQF